MKLIILFFSIFEELTLLSSRISDYPTITQGKTRIPGVNDAEEFEQLDVSWAVSVVAHTPMLLFYYYPYLAMCFADP